MTSSNYRYFWKGGQKLFLFSITFSWADTPWNRPDSLRIIPRTPQSWEVLERKEQIDVRIFWDQQDVASIEMLDSGRWKEIASAVHSGHVVLNVPIQAQFQFDYNLVFDILQSHMSNFGIALKKLPHCTQQKILIPKSL